MKLENKSLASQIFYIFMLSSISSKKGEDMILRFIAFIFLLLFLQACSPVYKVVYDYQPPSSKHGQKKLEQCYIDKKSCLERCNQKNRLCKQKAKLEAKREYQQRLFDYRSKLSTYNYKMRKKDDLEERFTFYQDVCKTKQDKYACTKATDYESKLRELKYLYKPTKPNEYNIYTNIVQNSCQENCGCDDLFRSCYISAGGYVSSHKVCIRNCD